MSAIVLQNNQGASFLPSVPVLYDNDVQNKGSLVLLDFSLEACWNKGVPRNLAADTAKALTGGSTGNELHPALAGKAANIRWANNALGLGAERARMEMHSVLTDYCVGRNIGYCIYERFINAQVMQPWVAGAAVALGATVYSGNEVYTVTTAGALGGTAPTHQAGAVANGTATLTAGVPFTSAPTYGSLYTQAFFYLGYPSETFYPSRKTIVGTSSQTQFLGAGAPAINRSKINQITRSPVGGIVNRAAQAQGFQLTSADVSAAPADRKLVLMAETFNWPGLYNATAGVAPQNLAGQWQETYRVHVCDLDVAGLTLEQFAAQEAYFFATYHPAASLLA